MYADAEKGIWRDDTERTDARDIAAIGDGGQLAVAWLDGQVVGTVHIQRLDPDVAELGMFVASPEPRGLGIGRTLVAFAEAWARQQGPRREPPFRRAEVVDRRLNHSTARYVPMASARMRARRSEVRGDGGERDAG